MEQTGLSHYRNNSLTLLFAPRIAEDAIAAASKEVHEKIETRKRKHVPQPRRQPKR
jgi:hypothetical protein